MEDVASRQRAMNQAQTAGSGRRETHERIDNVQSGNLPTNPLSTGNTRNEEIEEIIITIVKGCGFLTKKRGLKKGDVPDVYCKVKYGSLEWETHYVKDDDAPEWSFDKVSKYDKSHPIQDISIQVL